MIMIDIEMPDNCDECRFNTEYGFCKAMPDNFCGNTDDRKRPEWCPLKEQEAVEPRVSTAEQRCGNCNKVIEMDGWNACPWCGKPILWEAVGRSVKWE